MTKFHKFLPAVAVVFALAPYAAGASSYAPVLNQASHYFVTNSTSTQLAANSKGRPGENQVAVNSKGRPGENQLAANSKGRPGEFSNTQSANA